MAKKALMEKAKRTPNFGLLLLFSIRALRAMSL